MRLGRRKRRLTAFDTADRRRPGDAGVESAERGSASEVA